jgi:hypothetical protein
MVIGTFCEFLERHAALGSVSENAAFLCRPGGLPDTYWNMCLAVLVVLLRLSGWDDPASCDMGALQ